MNKIIHKSKTSTRQLLLETAGELFAKHGYNGTSVKMIAERSGQNMAAVNYHFGSKQNIFEEALKFVLASIRNPLLELEESSEITVEKSLRNFITRKCRFMLSTDAPEWYGKLVMQLVINMPPELQAIGLKFFAPDFQFLIQLAVKKRPDLSLDRIREWAYSILGQISFYVFGKSILQMANKQNTFDNNYVASVIDSIYQTSWLWLLHYQE